MEYSHMILDIVVTKKKEADHHCMARGLLTWQQQSMGACNRETFLSSKPFI
jgi:hypothetical protein